MAFHQSKPQSLFFVRWLHCIKFSRFQVYKTDASFRTTMEKLGHMIYKLFPSSRRSRAGIFHLLTLWWAGVDTMMSISPNCHLCSLPGKPDCASPIRAPILWQKHPLESPPRKCRYWKCKSTPFFPVEEAGSWGVFVSFWLYSTIPGIGILARRCPQCPYKLFESGCMFTWGTGDFQLVSWFLKKRICEMLLYMFVSEGNEGSGFTILSSC